MSKVNNNAKTNSNESEEAYLESEGVEIKASNAEEKKGDEEFAILTKSEAPSSNFISRSQQRTEKTRQNFENDISNKIQLTEKRLDLAKKEEAKNAAKKNN